MNDKVKSLFFSQYLGQGLTVTSIPENVNYPNYPFDINESGLFLSGILGSQIIVRRIAEDVKDRFNQTSLLLRDISQLTDEEAINVAKLSGFNFEDDTERAISYDTTLGEKNAKDYYINRGKSQLRLFIHKLNHRAYQYLNSLGYLLPFTYLSETNQPITLTPAEIINLGWAKIKSNEQ